MQILRKSTSQQKSIRALSSGLVLSPENLPEYCPMLPVNTYHDLAMLNAYLKTEDNFKIVVSKIYLFFCVSPNFSMLH